MACIFLPACLIMRGKKPPQEGRRKQSPCFGRAGRVYACVSQAVLKYHSPDRWDFHIATIVREKCFGKSKAAFSDYHMVPY